MEKGFLAGARRKFPKGNPHFKTQLNTNRVLHQIPAKSIGGMLVMGGYYRLSGL